MAGHPLPSLYRGLAGQGGPLSHLGLGGAAAKGGRGAFPSPKLIPPRETLGGWPAWALGPSAPGPLGQGASPRPTVGLLGRGPHGGPFRNLLEPSSQHRNNPEHFRKPRNQLPLYESYSPDYSGPPRDILDHIRDSEQTSSPYHIQIYLCDIEP